MLNLRLGTLHVLAPDTDAEGCHVFEIAGAASVAELVGSRLMSWGYFADLHLTIAADAWDALRSRKPAEISLEKGWSGLEEWLESAFGSPLTTTETFARTLTWFDGENEIHRDDTMADPRAV